MSRLAHLEQSALVAAGAVAAGVHAAIAPEHLREWLPLGASFVAVAIVLGVVVAAVALRPDERRFVAALAVLLGLVAVAYLATRLVALPPLDPGREAFDSLGIGTSAIEVLGVLIAIHVHRPALSSGGTE
jgi:hypothetical protein